MTHRAPLAISSGAEWLAGRKPADEDQATWFGGEVQMRVTLYLTPSMPPHELITSVRSVLIRDDQVLLMRDKEGGLNILPGGRREPGEAAEATLRREIYEESGWTFTHPRLLGALHFRHLTPKPDKYPYAYPEFAQPIFVAEADNFDSNWILLDDYVFSSAFVKLSQVRKLSLHRRDLVLLDEIARLRALASR
jgi:ADP-ribose pyrophosphatase YjhB (NUDIX family)